MNRDKDVDLTFSFDAVERWSLSNKDDDTPVTDTTLFTTAILCELRKVLAVLMLTATFD